MYQMCTLVFMWVHCTIGVGAISDSVAYPWIPSWATLSGLSGRGYAYTFWDFTYEDGLAPMGAFVSWKRMEKGGGGDVRMGLREGRGRGGDAVVRM